MISFTRILNIESHEERKVFLLLALGFFIGVFNVTFLVQSSSAFLNLFDEKQDLPRAIIYSGFLGVFLAWAFSLVQNRTSYSKLAFCVFILIFFVTISLRIGFEYPEYERLLTFASFVFIGPLNAITMLVFWGLVGRLFSIKQTKRIIGSIDSGQLIGTILSSFTIPLILRLWFESVDLLIIGSVSMVLLTVILGIITNNFPLELKNSLSVDRQRSEIRFRDLFKEKYIVIIASFIVISVIATVFVDYSFLHVTARNYPDPKDLAIFISRFEGTILIFSFVVQTFVTDKLISIYGLKITIIVTPLVVLMLSVVSMIAGLSLEYGDMFPFILFFLTVSLCKLFNTALRDAIDGPTIKLYILPVNSSIRLDVQSKIDGVIKLFASLIGGLILITIEFTDVFTATHVSLFLLAIIGAWIFVGTLMHRKYKETLQNTLANSKIKEENAYKTEYSIGRLLQKELESSDENRVLRILNLIEKVQPLLLADALKQIENSNLFKLKTIVNEKYGFKNTVEEISVISIDRGIELRKFAKSKSDGERIKAAQLIKFSNDADHIYLLNELLKDENNEVVKEAIQTAQALKHPEVFSALIELLALPQHSNTVSGTLISLGDEIIPSLEIAFQKADQKENVMYKILYIYGQIGSDLAVEKLWQKISYPDVQILTLILKAFHHLKVKANESQYNIVNGLLDNEIRKAAWNISALEEIDIEDHNYLLRQALEEEISENYDLIYILLALIYDDQSIQLVRDNIESGTSEGRVFALELLDIFVAKDLKDLLFPLLEDVQLEEKIGNLQAHFPRENFDSVEVLKQIINRDYNNIGRWTKACALYSYALTSKAAISDDLIANFFNPNNLIRETAAWAVVKKDKVVFKHILTRILNQKRNKNDLLLNELNLFTEVDNKRVLKIDKIVFLKNHPYFNNISGAVLAEFAELIQEVVLRENEEIQISSKQDETPVYIVYSGSISVFNGNILEANYGEKSLIEGFTDDARNSKRRIYANENTVLFSIQKSHLYEYMIKHYQLTQNLIGTHTSDLV